MTQTILRSAGALSKPAPNSIVQKFNQLQSDLMSKARSWAANEVGAAMGHQLNEPLTALLLYLHELKESCENSDGGAALPNAMREIVEKALRETQRVCDIMDLIGHPIEPPMDAESAVARGREAIASWEDIIDVKGDKHYVPRSLDPGRRLLTPREREVLTLVTSGSSNREGGHRLGISTRTFEVHRAHVMEKLGARNVADLVRMAMSEAR